MSTQKLTAKQDKFARLVAEGKTQADAYREAYNSAKMKPNTIHRKASELMVNGKITASVETYKKEFTKKLDIVSTITVERQIKYTQKVIQECLKTGDFNNSLKAMDMQNRLIGLYAPTKTDNKTTVEFTEKEARNSLKEKLKALDE
jgi:hypothetical protein